MPLADEYPLIDDRRYADLVAEARTRIPRYTDEWTDLNENEPAMAVVELFAWMTELLTYRLGKVPKLNYLKFVELLGIEMTPARPARAEVTLPVLPTFAEPYVIVPLHTQLETEEPDRDGHSIVFETERALVALSATLDAVQTHNGVSFADVSASNADADGKGFHPFGPGARPGSSVLFGFSSTQDFPTVEVNLMVWVKTRRANAPFYATCGEVLSPAATLQWEYWNGKEWRALDLLKDETAAFARSGHVYLNAPAKGEMTRAAIGKVAGARYWIRALLVAGSYQHAPEILAARTNTVEATQAESIDAEILGGSNGRPDQVFLLANSPVLAGTLKLIVDEGDGEREWREVADFFASTPDDPHYVLNRTAADIRFGGPKQRIPVANPRRPSNIVARSYRVGGGLRGNVGARQITTLRGAVGGINAGEIVNLFPAYGGTDEETLQEVRDRVPRTLKSRDRAVTREDFELHAIAAGSARARALPLFHPEFPDVEVPGVVSVIVVPEPSDPEDPAPMPTESTLRNVCAYLDARRLATVELYVVAPRYREIAVTAELVCRSDADLAEVKQQALTALGAYFHPLRGGEDGKGWPFGGDIYYSLVLQRLLLDGVRRVVKVQLALDGEPQPECTDVVIEPNALLRSGVHTLNVRYESET